MADVRTPGIQARQGGETPRQCWPRTEGIVEGGGGEQGGERGRHRLPHQPCELSSAVFVHSVHQPLACQSPSRGFVPVFKELSSLRQNKNNGYSWAVLCQAVHGTFSCLISWTFMWIPGGRC